MNTNPDPAHRLTSSRRRARRSTGAFPPAVGVGYQRQRLRLTACPTGRAWAVRQIAIWQSSLYASFVPHPSVLARRSRKFESRNPKELRPKRCAQNAQLLERKDLNFRDRSPRLRYNWVAGDARVKKNYHCEVRGTPEGTEFCRANVTASLRTTGPQWRILPASTAANRTS